VLVYYLTLNQEWFSKYDTDDPTFHNASYSNEVWSNLPGGTPEEYYKEQELTILRWHAGKIILYSVSLHFNILF